MYVYIKPKGDVIVTKKVPKKFRDVAIEVYHPRKAGVVDLAVAACSTLWLIKSARIAAIRAERRFQMALATPATDHAIDVLMDKTDRAVEILRALEKIYEREETTLQAIDLI